jgi:Domain of unknown function (DUF4190)
MTNGGYGAGQPDPFGPDPSGGPPSTQGFSPPPVTQGFFPGQGFPPTPGAPHGEVNRLATLSIVFAFVFAPVGVVLGHVALSQIKERGERGRERAIVGLTLSYVILVLALITPTPVGEYLSPWRYVPITSRNAAAFSCPDNSGDCELVPTSVEATQRIAPAVRCGNE